MDLVSVRTFCRTVEEGNLTAAAKALHITKSVASRRIQALEDDLGVRLLTRSTRGVSPTDAGTKFYERALTILDDLEDARQSIKGASEDLEGHIRIAAPRSLSDKELQAPLIAFMEAYPGLTFEMQFSDERVDIIGGGYDLALRVAKHLDDTSLIARKLAPVRSCIVASPNYLANHGEPQTPADLKEHQCVFYANVTASEQWRFEKNGTKETVRVQGRLTTNSGVMQLAAAKQGLAIAALPYFFAHDALAAGDVVTLLEGWHQPDSHLYALYPERRLLPMKVRALVDFLSAWFDRQENRVSL